MFHKPGISACIIAASLALPLFLPDPARCADVMLMQSIATELRYDTNAFIRSEEQAQTGDTVLLITPNFNIRTERRGLTLTASYRPNGLIYFNNSGLNSISHYASADMGVALTPRWSLSAGEVFTYSKETLDASPVGIQTNRATVWSNTVNLGTGYLLTEKTSVSLGVSDRIFRSDDPAAIKSRTDSASLGLGYSATAITTLNASYGASNFHFDTPTSSSDILTQSASVGLTHQFPYSLDVSLSGGASYTPSFNKNYDWIASVGVTKSFQSSSLSFEYVRGITNTSGLTDQLNINERYSASVVYAITPVTSVTLSGAYYQSKSTPLPLVRIKSYSAGISGQWSPYSWMILEAGYSNFRQTSDGVIGEDFKRDHFFLSMSVTTYEGKI